MNIGRLASSILIALILGGCTKAPATSSPPNGSPDQSPGMTGDQKTDWESIVKLEDQAKAIVNAAGCSAGDQCRTAAVGSRACGGPRYYLVYCARTTDSAALFRKLDEVARAERAYNEKYQMMSTCEFRMPPAVALQGGACTAQ